MTTRLQALDHKSSIKSIKLVISHGELRRGNDSFVYPNYAAEIIGLPERDLFALADLGALGMQQDPTGDPLLSLIDLHELVIRAQEIKEGKDK